MVRNFLSFIKSTRMFYSGTNEPLLTNPLALKHYGHNVLNVFNNYKTLRKYPYDDVIHQKIVKA